MTDPAPQWKTLKEMADMLRTSPKSVRRAAQRGPLESIRITPRVIRVRLPVDRRDRSRQGRNESF